MLPESLRFTGNIAMINALQRAFFSSLKKIYVNIKNIKDVRTPIVEENKKPLVSVVPNTFNTQDSAII